MKNFDNLSAIYEFLKENHKFNNEIQYANLSRQLAPFNEASKAPEAARFLLHNIYNTQSQPKLDAYAKFIEPIIQEKNALTSLNAFKRYLAKSSSLSEGTNLFTLLRKQSGWGDKTAALFVKNLYLIAKRDSLAKIFWSDIQDIRKSSEKLPLPVDAVIKNIFDADFKSINLAIDNYNNVNSFQKRHAVIWDDLWFWGFITQNSSANSNDSKDRTFEWNESKFRSIFSAHHFDLAEIKTKASEFLKITAS